MSATSPTSPDALRRALLALPLGLAAGPAAALPAELRFRVVRQGSAIGTHRVVFAGTAAGLTARTEVDIAVTLLGVTVFRFTHRFEESWAGDRLAGATSRLDRNGSVTEMRAVAEEGAILVQGSTGRFRLAAEARRHGHYARLELAGRSIKGVFKQADRLGARYVAVLGPDGVALKDMESGEQQTVDYETVMHHISVNRL